MGSERIVVRKPLRFSLRAIVNFVAVVDAGSMNRAAQTLHISQPWLSRQIQRLETDLGVQLMERGQAAQLLTPEGEALLPAMRDFVKTLENLETEGVSAIKGQNPASGSDAAAPPRH